MPRPPAPEHPDDAGLPEHPGFADTRDPTRTGHRGTHPGAPQDTRPASVWPLSGQGLDTAMGQDAVSRFGAQTPSQLQKRQAARLALCQPALALRVLMAVLASVALLAMPVSQGWRDWVLRVPVALVAAMAGTLLWLSLVCGLRRQLPTWPPAWAAALVMVLGGAAASIGWGLTVLLGVTAPRPWNGLGAVLCGTAVAAGLWSWLALRADATRPAEDGARLAELQSRIRPHFLFNALNTALALVQVDPPRAEAVLEDLSQLFRAALAETGSAVSVDDEVELAQRYLAIEQIRFGQRLQLEWDLDPAASEARLPPLVLQPLVENAVRHGVEPSAHGGRVTVRSRAYRGMATIEVSNTLPDEPGPHGTGLALANVRERLRLLHDLAGRLHTEVIGRQFFARIEVPL